MTVASKLKQTLAAIKGAEALIGQYGTHHPDEHVKRNFSACQDEIELMINDLEKRVQEIEFEEPQYKGY